LLPSCGASLVLLLELQPSSLPSCALDSFLAVDFAAAFLRLLWSSLLSCCLLARFGAAFFAAAFLRRFGAAFFAVAFFAAFLRFLEHAFLAAAFLRRFFGAADCSCLLTALLWSSWSCCLLALLWCCFLCCGHVLLPSEWFGIRHPNLFVDKRDINRAKMPTFCEKKFSACRKFIFVFFYAFAKILMFFISHLEKKLKNVENPHNGVKLLILVP